eukprot:CAMPEP_0194034562 /NCGR_PEP_ID=MMETSP0009_2-20130614/6978_1 /TAXON_ID=210454 /ORGANISM="Grammatophora oceanica, Strain CCMP 410" /LENGTH=292 /DNA_ID=CAMNT_0038675533 /DNA_START=208 /DNA_END=1086 /DNA_ORIENTATION=+
MTSNSNGSPDLARDYVADAEELVRLILPSCQDHPHLYNRFASMVQSMYKEADAVAGEKVEQISFVQSMPTAVISELDDYVWQERIQDAQRVDFLILQKLRYLRPTNKAKLAALQRRLHQEVSELQRDQVEQTKRRLVELKRTLMLMQVLMKECANDHVHVYNLFAVEMQRIQTDYARLKSMEQQEHYQNINGETPLPFWHRVKQSLTPPGSPQTPRPRERLSEDNATAEDRWMDVVWLDDAIDRMQDEPVVGRLLVRFKSKCAAEAKTLQKREALQMMPALAPQVPNLTVGY